MFYKNANNKTHALDFMKKMPYVSEQLTALWDNRKPFTYSINTKISQFFHLVIC